jgi:hypothetical protein
LSSSTERPKAGKYHFKILYDVLESRTDGNYGYEQHCVVQDTGIEDRVEDGQESRNATLKGDGQEYGINKNHLGKGLHFRAQICPKSFSAQLGERSKERDRNIPHHDDPDHPPIYEAKPGESDECRGGKHFVRERIKEDSPSGNLAEFSRNPAIIPIRERRYRIHDNGHLLKYQVFTYEECHKYRRKKNS